MKTLEKIMSVLARNLGLTVVFALAIVLFAIFWDVLIGGLITAFSALVAYTCGEMLYKEFKKTGAPAKPGKKK